MPNSESRVRCSAFEPRFKVVNSIARPEKSVERHLNKRIKEQYFNLLNSDKIKYQRTLALQRLKRDPDAIFMQLKYHLAWNVKYRKPAFKSDGKIAEAAYRLFNESSVVVNDFVNLISLATDHVHILVESNGELSIEELVNRVKEFTGNGLFKESPELRTSFDNDSIWDDAYFVETIG